MCGVGGDLGIRFKDPREIALKSISEIRNQIQMRVKMAQGLYGWRGVQDFMHVVIDAINSVDPRLKDRITAELRARNVLHQSSTPVI